MSKPAIEIILEAAEKSDRLDIMAMIADALGMQEGKDSNSLNNDKIDTNRVTKADSDILS